jgi:NhaA family Na+:H+ antiporter
VLLLAATAVALVWVNSPLGDSYHEFWETPLSINLGDHHLLDLSLHGWVNDALMALFFFVVGLEIKAELVAGDLSNPRVAALPAIGALGGMVIPAVLYLAVNLGTDTTRGWGVPMATDIAFAVGVLNLLGKRVPHPLKLFLLTLAIVDDIGAILVIAIFYSSGLNYGWLAVAAALLVVIIALRRFRVWYIPVYVLLGIGVWFATHESGVHATIAGVALGLLTPAAPLLGGRAFERVEDILSGDTADPAAVRDASWRMRESVPVTGRLITLLSPWTSFLVIPLFALANAGVELSGEAIGDALGSRVTLGVVLGLVIGKPLGVYLFSLAAVRTNIGTMPAGLNQRHLLGGGAVAGIGFTVALFVATLAFNRPEVVEEAIIGILAASVGATLLGWVILSTASPSDQEADAEGSLAET